MPSVSMLAFSAGRIAFKVQKAPPPEPSPAVGFEWRGGAQGGPEQRPEVQQHHQPADCVNEDAAEGGTNRGEYGRPGRFTFAFVFLFIVPEWRLSKEDHGTSPEQNRETNIIFKLLVASTSTRQQALHTEENAGAPVGVLISPSYPSPMKSYLFMFTFMFLFTLKFEVTQENKRGTRRTGATSRG